MRGAQPDAVCPRCDHRQPPSNTPLAHCAQCGLTFQPKELLVRTKRPTRVDDEEPVFDASLVVSPPASLKVNEVGEEIVYAWTNHPKLFGYASVVCGLVAIPIWLSSLPLYDQFKYSIWLLVIALVTFLQSMPTVQLRLAKRHLRVGGGGMLLLSELKRVELDGSYVYAVTGMDDRVPIAHVYDRAIGAYLTNTITKRFHDLDREKRAT
jgi:hypothetical protein